MKKVLMLAVRMSMGFGVSVVVGELSSRLLQRGVEVSIGTLEFDDYFSRRFNIINLPASADMILDYCTKEGIDTVIAHTSPYFEVLAEIDMPLQRWAWEHGDPTPELFVVDSDLRQQIIENKRHKVYPKLDGVIAISEFVRQEIRWPFAEVIYNGCDHLTKHSPTHNPDRALRVGSLMRMGEGERFYKGGELLTELTAILKNDSRFNLEVMGRGTEADAEYYRREGIQVHLNASDAERSSFLSGIDIFVSLSLWEGFNLPLVEAQVSGVLGAAMDVGAHPEVTPFLFSCTDELAEFIRFLDSDRDTLYEFSVKAQKDCLDRFRWEHSVDQMLEIID